MPAPEPSPPVFRNRRSRPPNKTLQLTSSHDAVPGLRRPVLACSQLSAKSVGRRSGAHALRGRLEEILEIADGLWLWRVHHPGWKPGADWDPIVTCTCVKSGGQIAVLDALPPPDDSYEFWSRFERARPDYLVVLLPDHVRGVDVFAQRFSIPAYGPYFFWRDDIPDTDLVPIDPGTCLPGNLLALSDGRGRKETPIWAPEQRALIFGDALTERDGALRIAPCPLYSSSWSKAWHEKRVLPELKAMLEYPFERVIVSHGEPLHDRAAFERALNLPPLPPNG